MDALEGSLALFYYYYWSDLVFPSSSSFPFFSCPVHGLRFSHFAVLWIGLNVAALSVNWMVRTNQRGMIGESIVMVTPKQESAVLKHLRQPLEPVRSRLFAEPEGSFRVMDVSHSHAQSLSPVSLHEWMVGSHFEEYLLYLILLCVLSFFRFPGACVGEKGSGSRRCQDSLQIERHHSLCSAVFVCSGKRVSCCVVVVFFSPKCVFVNS